MRGYFDKTASTRVIADNSTVGLGSVLVEEVGRQSREMPVDVLVTMNVGRVKPRKKLWHLFGPVKGSVCT